MSQINPSAGNPAKVIALSGLDPSGGAGIAADIAVIHALGGHAMPLISCQTIQDGREFVELSPVSAEQLTRQFRLLAKLAPAAIKIGLLADAGTIEAIGPELARCPGAPVVFDPVLRAGYCGSAMSGADAAAALRKHILPHCFVLTPNRAEALELSGETDIDRAARRLADDGCAHTLVTSACEEGGLLIHRLYDADAVCVREYRGRRRARHYHGTGCALSAAITGCLAQGFGLADAIARALDYVDRCMDGAWPFWPEAHFLRWPGASGR